jgi:co-chaperonin GroES (HSP10)
MQGTKWQPAGNKILVACDAIETKTKGGIIVAAGTLLERQEMKQMVGTVIAMGPMAYKDQPVEWVKVGDRVKFTQFAGYLHTEEDDDTKYRVMHDLDIIMVFKGE